jgi:hypothetical protein
MNMQKQNIKWDELERSSLFLNAGAKLQDKYSLKEKIVYCGPWLIRENFNKPFISHYELTSKIRRETDESIISEMQYDLKILNTHLTHLLDEGKGIIDQFEKMNLMHPRWNSNMSHEENNQRLEEMGFASYASSFSCLIKIKKATQRKGAIEFFVRYGDMKANQNPYFSTEAQQWSVGGDDISQGGQAQRTLLPRISSVYKFYKKWDGFHTSMMRKDEYEQMRRELKDLEEDFEVVYFYGK